MGLRHPLGLRYESPLPICPIRPILVLSPLAPVPMGGTFKVSLGLMNVEVENLPNCMAALRIELPPDRVTQEWNEIVKGYRQVARIPGFRPGKAPRAVIEAKFRKEIQKELTRKLINNSTTKAIRGKGR